VTLPKKVKVLGHERGQFPGVGIQIGQQPLDGSAKLGEGWIILVPEHLFAQKLPEPFNQVQFGE
jgi:hypothetical protein